MKARTTIMTAMMLIIAKITIMMMAMEQLLIMIAMIDHDNVIDLDDHKYQLYLQ